MKNMAIILVLVLVLGAVFISGCTTTQNNTRNNTGGNAQNKSPSILGYSIGQILSILHETRDLM